MQIIRCSARDKLDITNPFGTAMNGWLLQRVTPTGFPQTAIGAQQVGVLMAELLQVNRADFLLALDQKVDFYRQRALGRQPGLNRLKPQHQVAFVVGHAACKQLPIAWRWIESRRDPTIQRLGRLDIVVIVDQQRARAATD